MILYAHVTEKKMAEDWKPRNTKQNDDVEDSQPNKDEYRVAQYMKAKVPVNSGVLYHHDVQFFIASEAIDLLLDSEFSRGSNSQLFTNREEVETFLHSMLCHKFFHRAKKISPAQKQKKKKKNDDADEDGLEESSHVDGGKEKRLVKGVSQMSRVEMIRERKKRGKRKVAVVEKHDKSDSDEDEDLPERKRRTKLDMHKEQVFVDGDQVYVWIYDPVPIKSWVIGGIVVLAVVMIYLFPIWPPGLRRTVYHLSVAAAVILAVIIGLVVLRLLVFCVIWGVSLGRHHLWILPNLTEDVGILESFWPLYKYEYRDGSEQEDKKKTNKKKSKKKEKDSDQEENDATPIEEGSNSEVERGNSEGDGLTSNESGSEGSGRHSGTGSNGFELVDSEENEST